MHTVKIIGSYLSPYVRKVLVVLNLKGIGYTIDPIIPFLGDDRFTAVSPLRRIPVLIDDQVTLCDSSVICQYLEDRFPEPAVYPRDIAQRARARWLEEYADTHMGDVIIWKLYDQMAITPFVWGKPTDQDIVQTTLNQDLPRILDHLEAQVPETGFFFGAPSIADVSIASFFRNAKFVRFEIDANKWPRTAGYIQRTLELEAFAKLKPFEDKLIRTKIPLHRETLSALGAPLTADTFFTSTPRRGFR